MQVERDASSQTPRAFPCNWRPAPKAIRKGCRWPKFAAPTRSWPPGAALRRAVTSAEGALCPDKRG
eukprot:3593400-Lingulodinium_polyedra.AAC.1